MSQPEKIFQLLREEIWSVLDLEEDRKKQSRYLKYPTEYQQKGNHQFVPVWTASRRDRIKGLIDKITSVRDIIRFLPFPGAVPIDQLPLLLQISDMFLPKIQWNKFLFEQITKDGSVLFGKTNILELYILGGKSCSSFLRSSNYIEVNRQNDYQQTPLMYALYVENIDCIRFLLESGADPNIGQILHSACANSNTEIVKLLIKGGADVNREAPDGNTPLHTACMYNTPGVVRVLIDSGADVDANHTLNNQTPFHLTLYFNDPHHLEIAKLLVKAGADVNKRRKNGLSPLHIANLKGREKAFRYLFCELAILIQEELKEIKALMGQEENSFHFNKRALQKQWQQIQENDPASIEKRNEWLSRVTELEDSLGKKLQQLVRKQQRSIQQRNRSQMRSQDQRPFTFTQQHLFSS